MAAPREAVRSRAIPSRVLPRNQGEDQGPRKKAFIVLPGFGELIRMRITVNKTAEPIATNAPKRGEAITDTDR
jgi:hypothetical protein